MTSEDKRWDRLKADYLGKVEKALSSVQHPRRNEVLEDVRAHLERRFAELAPEQHTLENLQTIITEMGPASDYAELLEPQAPQPTGYLQRKYVLWFGLAVIVIAAVIVPLTAIPDKKSHYIVTFKPVAPFNPRTDRELLDAFNETHPKDVKTHHFKTGFKDDVLYGLIRVDTEAGRDAIVSMLEKCEKLALIEVKPETMEELERFYRVGRPSQIGHRGRTVSRTGHWPEGHAHIFGSVYRKIPHRESIGHAKVCLSSEEFGTWIMEVDDSGHFEFQNIPATVYTLRTMETFGYKDTYYNPEKMSAQQPTFELKRAETESADIEVEPVRPYGRISGNVLDEDGEPIRLKTRRLQVIAWVQKPQGRWKGHYRRMSTSYVNEKGAYLLKGLDGRPVYVQVLDRNAPNEDHPYPPRFYPGTFSRSAATLVTFQEKSLVDHVDIPMKKKGGIALMVVVTDQSTGAPVPEALVSIFHHDMFFDLFCAYSDQQGRYRIDGLGDGEFIVHVDAVHKGLVKTRKLLTIKPNSQEARLDFMLRPGVTISGRFVDVKGDPWKVGRGYGRAYAKGQPGGGPASNFRYGNKFAPPFIREGSTLFSEEGQGDHPSARMVFPADSSFLLPAVMPGKVFIDFRPRGKGEQVLKILYRDTDILHTGLVAEPGQDIDNITVVIGQAWQK